MRTNKKLAVAITATLFSLSGVETVFAAGLTNLTAGDVPSVGANDYGTGGNTGTIASGTAASATTFTPAPATENGIKYASELFGTVPTSIPSDKPAGVIYEIDGAIDKDFFLTFTLTGSATFATGTQLYTSTSNASLESAIPTDVSPDGGSIKYTIEVEANTSIASGSKFLLAYKLASTGSLSSVGSKIDMQVTATSVGTTAYNVNITDDVTVAQSIQGVKIDMLPIEPVELPNAKVSTATGSTEFVSTDDITTKVYQSINEVKLGKITIDHDTDAMSLDGSTPFKLGIEGNDGEVQAATLIINDGQFSASKNEPGEIKLDGDPATVSIGPTDVTIDEEGTTATIVLKDVMDDMGNNGLNAINTTNFGFIVDGTTAINVPENSPCATLNIDFKTSGIADITVPDDGCVTLPRIPLDGTICWVNIIPPAGNKDDISILITNNGVDEAELKATMYDQAGEVLFTNQTLKDSAGTTTLEAGKTMRIGQTDLALLMDGATVDAPGTWTGRAVMKVSTVLSDIEILTLLRDTKSNINSNVSQGAAGASCTK